jgi:hypothetical protein
MNWVFSAVAGGVGILYFGAVLTDILTDWERYKEKVKQKGIVASRSVLAIAAAVMLSASFGAAYLSYTEYRSKNPSIPKSIEEAQRFVPGVWVFAEPLKTEVPHIILWQRWIIRKDGTLDIYQAPPARDSWGQPQTYQYKIVTDKYQDTGQRFYAVHIEGTRMGAFIEEDGALLVRDSDKVNAVLYRGDKNPFSK